MNHIPDLRRAFMLRGAAIAAAVAAPGIARSTGALLVGMSLPLRGPQSRQAEATRQGVDAVSSKRTGLAVSRGSLLQLVTVDNEYSPEKTAESLKTFAAQRAVALTSLMGGAAH
jgi:ABC-type branched-subunit amino acid transport system substrate-binding protein